MQQVNYATHIEDVGNLFYASYDFNGKKLSDVWYIDIGCNNHMTFGNDLLADININVKAKVQVGTAVLVGKGSLVIKTMRGNKYIREVMMVLEIAENLLKCRAND